MGDQPDHEFRDSDYEFIRRKAQRIMKYGFNDHDLDDACQIAAIAVCNALPRLDPTRGNREALINTVTQSKVLSHIAEMKAAKRGGGKRHLRLYDRDGGLIHDPLDHEADTPALDTMVFEELIQRLPEHLREFARLKTSRNGPQIQKAMGITRGKYRELEKQLKQHLEAWKTVGEKILEKSPPTTTNFPTVPVVDCGERPSLPPDYTEHGHEEKHLSSPPATRPRAQKSLFRSQPFRAGLGSETGEEIQP